MRKRMFFISTLMLLIVSLVFNSVAFACGGGMGKGGPIVSTEWLAANIGKGNLVIVDIRSEEEYQAGHIEGSINIPYIVPFSAWLTMKDDLLLELPEKKIYLNS